MTQAPFQKPVFGVWGQTWLLDSAEKGEDRAGGDHVARHGYFTILPEAREAVSSAPLILLAQSKEVRYSYHG